MFPPKIGVFHVERPVPECSDMTNTSNEGKTFQRQIASFPSNQLTSIASSGIRCSPDIPTAMVDPLSFLTLRRVKKPSGCHYVGGLEKDAFFKFLSLNFIMCDDDAANTIPRSRCPLPPPRLFPDPCDYERPFLHHQRVVQRLTLTGQPRGALAVRAISTIREHDDDS